MCPFSLVGDPRSIAVSWRLQVGRHRFPCGWMMRGSASQSGWAMGSNGGSGRRMSRSPKNQHQHSHGSIPAPSLEDPASPLERRPAGKPARKHPTSISRYPKPLLHRHFLGKTGDNTLYLYSLSPHRASGGEPALRPRARRQRQLPGSPWEM